MAGVDSVQAPNARNTDLSGQGVPAAGAVQHQLGGLRPQQLQGAVCQGQELATFVDLILGRTQQAMDVATAAACEAQRLMASDGALQSAPVHQQSFQAAEAAMESAEQALSVALKLLKDTQTLVLTHQQLQGTHAGHIRLQHMIAPSMPAWLLQEQLDPDLQDTCDSLQTAAAISSGALSLSR